MTLNTMPFKKGLALLFLILTSSFATAGAMLGANKFDLLQQYFGYASTGDGSKAFEVVERAAARKSIQDAHNAGFSFLRVSVVGFRPIATADNSNDLLQLWRTSPEKFWSGMDEMFSDLQRNGLRIVPTLIWTPIQYAAMSNETGADFIANKRSKSQQMAATFVSQFARRYRSSKLILFYELTNEFDLLADLDLQKRCKLDRKQSEEQCRTIGNFSTEELIRFDDSMLRRLKKQDPGHLVSSGFSFPRTNAYRLRRRPEWSSQGADWTPDNALEHEAYIADTQSTFDVMSIHLYPGALSNAKLDVAGAIHLMSDQADRLHKKLFIGEFGDESIDSAFVKSVLTSISQDKVDYAAIWAWEFHQVSLAEQMPNNGYSISPSLRPDLLYEIRMRTRNSSVESPTNTLVVMNWPLPCARLDAVTRLDADASEGPGRPLRVEFLLDGRIIAIINSPPYVFEFHPTLYPAGLSTLAARAVGGKARGSTFSIPVQVGGGSAGCETSASIELQ